MRTSRHCAGTASSISLWSSPRGRSARPQSGHAQLPGAGSIRCSARGGWAGNARTGEGRSDRTGSARLASATTAAASSYSRAGSSWAICRSSFSDDLPNFIRLSRASWTRSVSMRMSRAEISAWAASDAASNSAMRASLSVEE